MSTRNRHERYCAGWVWEDSRFVNFHRQSYPRDDEDYHGRGLDSLIVTDYRSAFLALVGFIFLMLATGGGIIALLLLAMSCVLR